MVHDKRAITSKLIYQDVGSDDEGGAAVARDEGEEWGGGSGGEDEYGGGEESSAPKKKKARVTGKAKGKGRVSKLEYFKSMPLDILSEICSHLDPLTLLYMSRTSKSIRSLLLAPYSRPLWTSARRNVDLPDLESEDMTDAAWASLIFERNCMVYGKGRASVVDYYVRARYCKKCQKINLLNTRQIHRELGTLHFATLGCSPFSRISMTGRRSSTLQYFFKPAVISLNERLASLYEAHKEIVDATDEEDEREKTEYERIVGIYSSSAHAARRITEAEAIIKWLRMDKRERADQASAATAKRKAAIEGKVFALGWDRQDFGHMWWSSSLVNQPKDLTDKIWLKISPEIISNLQRNKETRLHHELGERQQQRSALLRPHYTQLVATLEDQIEKDSFPPFDDFIELASVKVFWEADDSVVQDDVWLGGIDAVALGGNLDAFRARVKLSFFRHLVKAMNEAGTPLPAPLLAKLDPPPPVDPSSPFPPALTDAEMDPYFLPYTSRFHCYPCSTFHSFPAICGHQKSHGRGFQRGSYYGEPAVSGDWGVAVMELFAALGITPNEGTDAELEAMGAGFACKGCSTSPPWRWPAIPGPSVPVAGLKWSELISHAFKKHFQSSWGSSLRDLDFKGFEFVKPEEKIAVDLEEMSLPPPLRLA